MVAICLSIEGNQRNGESSARLERQVQVLAGQISDMQRQIANVNFAPQASADLPLDDQERQQRCRHMEAHISAARTMFSDASVYNESIAGTVIGDSADVADLAATFGSVVGLSNDQTNRIRQWMPRAETFDHSDEEDEDVEMLLFNARLALARKKLYAKEYQAAQRQFRTCSLNTAVLENLPMHTMVEIKIDFASACEGSGHRNEQKEILLEILELDLEPAQRLHLQHILAVAYLNDEDFENAQLHAETAMFGRRKLFGSNHETYRDSIQLLVDICDARNELDDAEVYRHLLLQNVQAQRDHFSTTTTNQVAQLSESPGKVLAQVQEVASIEEISRVLPSKKSLHEAAFEGDQDRVKWLLDHGADIEMMLRSDMAFRSGRSDDFPGYTPLLLATYAGQPDIVQLLLERGANIEAIGETKRTSLLIATCKGHTSTVQLLLDRGAHLHAVNKIGQTALQFAASLGHQFLLEILLDRGANIEPTDWLGDTALHDAVIAGHSNVVRVLLDRGAKVDVQCKSGDTALHHAVKQKNPTTARLLVDRGAKVNVQNNHGYTALILSSVHGTDVMKILLEHGADVSLKDTDGLDAMWYARYFRERRRMLKQYVKIAAAAKKKG
ncbi:hypothetical protein FKW77_000620 [Venturia effusa]|uniref:Uncharacterized protein n=1 Tax=Venturia effusa TaxID=50376 RepID=A0A517L2L8_9PEZI|nr:hypothetical protein FKW77_000620 [Venturia effusa]